MKKILIVLPVLLFGITCCTRDEKLSVNEKERIIAEIKVLTAQILEDSEAVDMEKAHSPYLNSPEFIHSSNGKESDFEGFMKGNQEYFNTISLQKFIPTSERYTVLNSETVVANWTGKIVANKKDGTIGGLDHFGVTLIFTKHNGEWKAVNSHESW